MIRVTHASLCLFCSTIWVMILILAYTLIKNTHRAGRRRSQYEGVSCFAASLSSLTTGTSSKWEDSFLQGRGHMFWLRWRPSGWSHKVYVHAQKNPNNINLLVVDFKLQTRLFIFVYTETYWNNWSRQSWTMCHHYGKQSFLVWCESSQQEVLCPIL